jgi:hypothetical protein
VCQGALTGKQTLLAGALERRERRRRGQQLAQHNCPRHANAHGPQDKLRDSVLAQRGERDPAEVGHNGVLEHRRGQMARGIARDFIEANAVCHRGGDVREVHDGYAQSVCFPVRVLTQKQPLWGGGAPQVGDLRLLEDGGERGGALVSDLVIYETASKGWDGDGGREEAFQLALTRKRALHAVCADTKMQIEPSGEGRCLRDTHT